MIYRFHLAALCLLTALCGGCATTPPADTLTQLSTIDALLAGAYDGQLSGSELLEYGDFGLGTFDHLDGEMVVMDGRIYQVKADGKVYEPETPVSTPFAAVSLFDPERQVDIPAGMAYDTLKEMLKELAPNPNIFYALRLEGDFKQMHTRSVPRQQKPYPPLSAVATTQPEFLMQDIAGTIIGFRSPDYVKGIGVPGSHLHFLSSDLTRGGHILDFTTGENMRLLIDPLSRFMLLLPGEDSAMSSMNLTEDRSQELHQVEQGSR